MGINKTVDFLDSTPTCPRPPRRRGRLMMLAVLLACLTYTLYSNARSDSAGVKTRQDQDEPWKDHLWAQYTPFFPVKPYQAVQDGCIIDQVNIIQRHGARYPTSGASARIRLALEHFKTATGFTNPNLTFIENWTYDLGQDDLIPFGAEQSVDSGKEVYERYTALVSNESLPFVRASDSERVVLSAINWTEGFSLASQGQFNPVLSVIISEELNDTLDDAMCPNAGSADEQTDQWLAVYADPLATTLNSEAPGANLTGVDVYNLISLCAFDTLAKETRSPWCDVFSKEDFESFEYSGDLDKYYGTGYGQDLGPVQGVGYINELLARLTNSPVEDNTQTNHTLDSDPATFPLNSTIYADFSHDNQMIAIYAAIGLFKQAEPLDPTAPDPARNWKASELVPFGARMVVERFSCGGAEQKYVRILVNDASQPLEFCGEGDGSCTLEAFVESQSYARNDGEGDFERCFE